MPNKYGLTEVEFQGEQYLLVGDMEYASLCTEQQFENFEISFAHLFPDGKIKRFNDVLGTKADMYVVWQPPNTTPKTGKP